MGVAYATVYRPRHSEALSLTNVHVREEFRRQGLGKAFILRILGEHPKEEIRLTAIPSDPSMSYEQLEGFYESVGFRKVSKHDMVRAARA